MTRTGRSSWLRPLAGLLVVVQALSFALAPYAEARTSSPPDLVAHIESGHGAACVVVHRPDNCLACQLLSATRTAPATGLCALPVGTLVRVPPFAASVAGRPSGTLAPHLSRAPPASPA